jgi:Flp pilus assembly protein TadD
MWTRWSKAILLMVLIALRVMPVRGQIGAAIEGQVSTINNLPLPPDVTVRLEAAEGTYVNQAYVGGNGRFVFDNLQQGLYRLVVTAKGYRTVTQTVDMSWAASRLPRIYLVPVVKKTLTSSGSSTVTATDLTAPKMARKEYEKGLRDLEHGNFGGARKHLEKAVAEHSCYARAHTVLGVALSMSGQFEAAESAFAKSITCDGGFVEAYIQRAVVLNAQNKYPDCEAAIRQGLRRFPNEWQLHYQLGIAKDGAGDYAGAEQALLKAQSINPEVPPEFHLRIADVYLNSQNYEKAHAEMAEYLRADPHGSYAEPTRKIMRRMETSGMVPNAQGKKDSKKP